MNHAGEREKRVTARAWIRLPLLPESRHSMREGANAPTPGDISGRPLGQPIFGNRWSHAGGTIPATRLFASVVFQRTTAMKPRRNGQGALELPLEVPNLLARHVCAGETDCPINHAGAASRRAFTSFAGAGAPAVPRRGPVIGMRMRSRGERRGGRPLSGPAFPCQFRARICHPAAKERKCREVAALLLV